MKIVVKAIISECSPGKRYDMSTADKQNSISAVFLRSTKHVKDRVTSTRCDLENRHSALRTLFPWRCLSVHPMACFTVLDLNRRLTAVMILHYGGQSFIKATNYNRLHAIFWYFIACHYIFFMICYDMSLDIMRDYITCHDMLLIVMTCHVLCQDVQWHIMTCHSPYQENNCICGFKVQILITLIIFSCKVMAL